MRINSQYGGIMMNDEDNENNEKPRHIPWGSRDEKLGDDVIKMLLPDDLDTKNKDRSRR